MSIVSTDLVAYGCANRPSDDVSAAGGAIDATRRPVFTQLSSSGSLTYVSDGSDVRSITVTGRDGTGAVVTESVGLNGSTTVNGSRVFERVQKAELSTSDGARTVTVNQGATVIGTIPPNEVGFYGLFLNSASSGTQVIRYEKVFWKNNNASLTLNSANITLTADPAAKIKIGVSAAVGDSVSITNRLTSPSGITFVGVGVAQSIPGGSLSAATSCGCWVQQTLNANDAPVKNNFTTQLAGTSV